MRTSKIVMGVLYVAAGTLHFVFTRRYASIIPGYLPHHRGLVLLSGAAEIAGGVGVLVRNIQRAAAWGIVLLLIAVFPANLWMAQHPAQYRFAPVWTLWLRLPLQLVLIGWALRFTRDDHARNRLASASGQ
jgi:uncharacterized membrane protein